MGPARHRRSPHGRRHAIVRLLQEEGQVSVAQLAARFQVSEVTIRKDLSWLEREHQAVRIHGGAVLTVSGSRRTELAFEAREPLQRAEKAAIGQEAARLVQEGDSIALDASTTALYLARCLRGRRELTVVTNGLRNAVELGGRPGVSVLMPGGAFRWEAYSLVGSWGRALLQRVNIATAFVGAVGLSLEEGLTDVTDAEAEAKRAMVAAAKTVVALVDHTKWGKVSFATFCPLDRVHLIITDTKAPAEMVEQVRRLGVEVRQVPPLSLPGERPPGARAYGNAALRSL
jgi:DeoR/GlpR family transcriptional regulator of sugar metabolism